MSSSVGRRAQVLLPGGKTGKLTQDRHGSAHWIPDDSWEARTQMPRLGFDFLRAPGRRTVHQDLPPWFENLLPERESALRMRLCGMYGLRDGQSFQLLMAVGRDLPGAVEVHPESAASMTEAPEPQGNAALTPTDRNQGRDQDEDAARPSSLAGVQLKFGMSMVGERLAFGARSGKSEWIVKLPGEYAELPEVETATMSWASQAGFDVPRHRTVPFDSLDGIPAGWAEPTPTVFAIERFDRRSDGSRVHHEDFCQALGLRPMDKYGDRSSAVRYEGAFRFVLDACGENAGREFTRRLGFMIASGNTDAHLKNWGLLWGDRVRPELVPCYDLVSTIAWEKFGWQRAGGPRLALRFGTTQRFADIDDDMLERFVADTGAPWAAPEIQAGIELARDALPALRAPVPNRMTQALREHWSRVPLLRRFGPVRVTADQTSPD